MKSNGVGKYLISFSPVLASANYSVSVSTSGQGCIASVGSKTSNNFIVQVTQGESLATAINVAALDIQVCAL
jgi:hypothetical protein